MSRRTERSYKVDGTDKLAPHSAVQCSVPEINGPAVQQEFTFLLRETCSPSPSAAQAGYGWSGNRRGLPLALELSKKFARVSEKVSRIKSRR